MDESLHRDLPAFVVLGARAFEPLLHDDVFASHALRHAEVAYAFSWTCSTACCAVLGFITASIARRCWAADAGSRPSFTVVVQEISEVLQLLA
jgi:hypothetical protein